MNISTSTTLTLLLILVSSVGSLKRSFEPAGGRFSHSAVATPKLVDLSEMEKAKARKDTALLSVQVYKTLQDAVIFDWYISLTDKDKMEICNIFYRELPADDEEDRTALILSNFLPKHRTFLLYSLKSNQTYDFHMECQDINKRFYSTKDIEFTTEPKGTDTSKDFHSHQQLEWRFGNIDEEVLPVVINGNNQQQSNNVDNVNNNNNQNRNEEKNLSFGLRGRTKDKISPHLVLGLSCSAVGFVIFSITIGLAGKRYRQYRSSPSRLWELQAAKELESMPSYIHVPNMVDSSWSGSGDPQLLSRQEEEEFQLATYYRSAEAVRRGLELCNGCQTNSNNQNAVLLVHDNSMKDDNANII